MTDERHIIEVNVTGNADEKLDDIAKLSGKAEKQTKQLTTANKSQQKGLGKLTEGLEIAKLGYAAIAAAVLAAAKAAYDAARAYAVQMAELGKLNRSVRQVGGTYEDFKRSQDLAREASNTYGVELNAAMNGIQSLTEASGDAKTAQEDFTLALDISAQSGQDLTEVTRALAEARRGEFEGLKRYVGFNKRAIEALTSTEDSAAAAAEAFKTLKGNYDGAAQRLKGADEDFKALDQRLKNMKENAGGLFFELTRLATSDTGKVGKIAGAFEQGAERALEMARAVNAVNENIEKFSTDRDLLAIREALLSGNISISQAANLTADRVNSISSDQDAPKEQEQDFFQGPTISPDELREKRIAERQRKKDEAEAARERAKQRGQERQDREDDIALQQKNIEILKAEGEEQQRILEYERQILEIKQQRLSPAQESLRLTQAEMQLQRDLSEIEQRRQEEFQDGVVEQQLAYYEELKGKQKERDDREEALAKQTEKRLAFEKQMQLEVADANRTKGQAAISAAQGAAGVADLFIKSERARAAIRGAIAAAEATLAYASGNIPAGIGFTAAAAQFFAVAGGAGQSSGGSARASTAGRSRSGGSRSFEDRATTNQAGAIGRERGNTTVQMVFNAAFPPSPNNARQLVNAVDQEMRNRSAPNGVR